MSASDPEATSDDLTPEQIARVIAGLDPSPYFYPDLIAGAQPVPAGDVLPGTPAMVEVYAERAEAGLHLYHPEDGRRLKVRRKTRPGVNGRRLRLLFGVRTQTVLGDVEGEGVRRA